MQLRMVSSPGPQWTRGQQFINNYHTVPGFRISRTRHQLFLLEEETGGTFDEVTEEISGRDIGGVLVCTRDSYSSTETLVLVHPDHRRERWGYRLLRYLLENLSDSAYGQVNVTDATSLAFAAKYGSIQNVERQGGVYVANVFFSYQNPNWRHGNCRCHYCMEELSSLTGGRNSPPLGYDG